MPKAITEAEELAHDKPTKENLLNLVNLYLTKGDSKGITIVARRLNEQSDLTPEELLRVASLVQLEDQQLAISLWKQANSLGIPNDNVGAALDLGYQLGVEDELTSLIMRMQELGLQGQGGITIKTIEEVIEFTKHKHERARELYEIYQNGAGPIHIIAEQVNLPLVDLYHQALKENEDAPDQRRQPVLFARHGGRILKSGFPDKVPDYRLNLDVTAILLAEHLGILDKVENTLKPLRIPADIIPLLSQMVGEMKHHQPLRLKALKKIIEFLNRNVLLVDEYKLSRTEENSKLIDELGENKAALLESARTNSGYLVDFLPLTKLDSNASPTILPKDASKYLVNCRAIVEGLYKNGPLSKSEYEKALQKLGSEGQKCVSDVVPEKGSFLICASGISEVLVQAELLHIICDHYSVHCEKRGVDSIDVELKGQEKKDQTAKWLNNLIDRIGKGIDNGIYEIIPIPNKTKKPEEESSEGLNHHCLLTLLQFDAQKNDVIWSDDRYLNGYLYRDKIPIIGINEILKILVGTKIIDINEYYEKINKLRVANVRLSA